MSNTVVIMAGGLGKRMNSDESNILPKVLHKIKGKPMLLHVIETAISINPIDIYIIVGKYKDVIEKEIGNYNLSKKIKFVIQEEALGTGHAIQCCVPVLKNLNSNVIILSGDVPMISRKTLENLVNIDKIKLMTTILDNPKGYGRIVEKDNKFVKIVEDKDCNDFEREINKINSGIYSINSELICKYVMDLKNDNKQKEYYLTDIVEIIKENENIDIEMYNVPKENQFELMGVNTIEQLNQLNNII